MHKDRNKLSALIQSRRFWMAIVGIVAIAAEDLLGLDPEEVLMVGGVVVAWIIGDSVRKTE